MKQTKLVYRNCQSLDMCSVHCFESIELDNDGRHQHRNTFTTITLLQLMSSKTKAKHTKRLENITHSFMKLQYKHSLLSDIIATILAQLNSRCLLNNVIFKIASALLDCHSFRHCQISLMVLSHTLSACKDTGIYLRIMFSQHVTATLDVGSSV